MNCARCGHANREHARFCEDCGNRLDEAVAEAPARTHYTPAHLTERVLRSRSALEGERKQVTILFADLKGSMEIAEPLDAEVWHRIIDRFLQILADAVHRYEGTVNQYTGDGIMALFGAPIAHEDHAERACHAALEMRERLAVFAAELREQHPFDFRARIGINSGDVVVGKIGDDLRMDYTAQGHSVGLASRVEQLAEPGDVHLAEATARLVAGAFALRDLGPRALKGVREPVRLFALEGAGPARTRLDRSAQRGFSSFVGREQESAVLDVELSSVGSGRGRAVAVVGPPGVGKSRLLHEFTLRCRQQGLRVIETHALAHGEAMPLRPVFDLVRSSLGMAAEAALSDVREAALSALESLGLDPEPVPALVDAFFGVERNDASIAGMDPDARLERLFDALLGLLLAPIREPLVIRIEDAQWVDGASARFFARLIETIADRERGAPVLVALTLRGEAQPAWLSHLDHMRLALTALGPEESGALAEEWLGARDAAPELHELIARRARGNPLFIEEIVRSLVERGDLTGSRGAYRLTTAPSELSVPDTIRAIVTARIDRLADAHKHFLQIAAVMGAHFSSGVLRDVANLDEDAFGQAFSTLTAAGFIEAREAEGVDGDLRFAHPLTQEIAYSAQLSEARRHIHAEIAESLLRLHANSLHRIEALLAHHYERAERDLEAARWHERAGRRIARTDTGAGLEHCERVATQLEALPESAETLTLGLTSRIARLEIGRLAGMSEADADRIFDEARSVAERLGDPRGVAFLVSSYGRLCGVGGDVAAHFERCENALDIARRSGDPRLEFEMLTSSLLSLLGVGRLQEAERRAEDALSRLTDDVSLSQGESIAPEQCRIRAGWIFAYRGRFAEAEALLATDALEPGDRLRWENVHGVDGLRSDCAWLCADAEAAVAYGERACEIASRAGSAFSRVEAGCSAARAHLLAGDCESSDRHARAALELARDRRTALWYEARLLATRSEALLLRDDLGDALALANQAISVSAQGRGWRVADCDARLALARASLAAGERGQSEAEVVAAERSAQAMGIAAYRAPIQRVRDLLTV